MESTTASTTPTQKDDGEMKTESTTTKSKPILGKAASGRTWKNREHKRVSKMNVGTEARTSQVNNRAEIKAKKQALKEFNSAITAKQNAQKEQRRKSIAARKQRKADNVMKNTTIQIVKDPSKIKKMAKKRQKFFSKLNVNQIDLARVI